MMFTPVKNQKCPVASTFGCVAGEALPGRLGRVKRLLSDNGFFSEVNVENCMAAKIERLLAAGREAHHPHRKDRFSEPSPLNELASAVERMKHPLKTHRWCKLCGRRKQTVEAVFGIKKSVMSFPQFLLCGLAGVKRGGETGHDGTQHQQDDGDSRIPVQGTLGRSAQFLGGYTQYWVVPPTRDYGKRLRPGKPVSTKSKSTANNGS